MVSSIRYPIRRVVNWYYGNLCTRKCFNKGDRIRICYTKFEKIINSNPDLMITHKEFKDMIDNGDIKICMLNPEFRKRTVGWKQFEWWLRDKSFDPDKM